MSTATSSSLQQSRSNLQLKRKHGSHRPDCRHEYAVPFTLDRFVSRSQRIYLRLEPVCLFPWSKLAFSMLDPTDNDLIEYEGKVSMLEDGPSDRRTVLIAEEVETGRLFALEKHDGRTHKYTPCRMRSDWSGTSRVLRDHAIVWYEGVPEQRKAPKLVEQSAPRSFEIKQESNTCAVLSHRRVSSIARPSTTAITRASSVDVPCDRLEAPPITTDAVAPVLTVDSHMDLPVTALMSLSDGQEQEGLVIAVGESGSHEPSTISCELDISVVADKTAEDSLKDLNRHYLDTLYLSRTSIAYFVKGPLARARATTVSSSGEVTLFLRQLLLTPSTTEKRLKETLPDIIRRHMETSATTDKEHNQARRSKFKSKRDRQGLLHGEIQSIEQWWRQLDENDSGPASSMPLTQLIGQRLQTLRKRETFLQIAVLMETIALEENPPDRTSTNDNAGADDTLPLKKSRKHVDLPSHLETLLDRLAIWQSVDFPSPEKGDTAGDDIAKSQSKDELRSFCTEVIIPFYTSRVPKPAALINKRLGGPKAPSPLRRSASSSTRRPGEPAERTIASDLKQRKPLQRVATDPMLLPRTSTPSLERAASGPILQQDARVKRERSQSSSLNTSISARATSQRPRQDPLALLSRRQIDLTASSSAAELKLRRKAEQEAKVREAIASIKRPDRALALKENAAVVDASFAKTLQRKKVSSPHNQIMATPNSAQYIAATPRKAGDAETRLYSSSYLAPPEQHSAAPLTIPQTGHRERFTAIINPSLLQDDGPDFPFPSNLTETPLLDRSINIDSTPSRPRALLLQSDTPIAARSTEHTRGKDVTQRPPTNAMMTPAKERSVYDVLGWDNDEYEELA